jgi:hypothetical protein
MLNRTKTLEIPIADSESKGQPARFTERLSEPPVNPFESFFFPIVRELAQSRGDEIVSAHLREMTSYHGRSCRQLSELSSAIRSNGQRVFRTIQNELRQRLKRFSTLGQIAQSLRVFFPEFATLRADRRSHPVQACEPASYPVQHSYGSAARDLLKKQCQQIPSFKFMISGAATGLILLLLGSLAFFKWDSPANAKILGGLGLLVILTITIWATVMAYRAKQALTDYYETKHREILEHFRRRLGWVVDSTGLTVESQIIGDALAVQRTLQAQFEAIYGNWQNALQRLSQQDIANLQVHLKEKLQRGGISEEDALRVRGEIAGLGVDMTDLATGKLDREMEARIKRALPRAIETLALAGSKNMVAPEKIQDEVFACVSPQEPPFLARLEQSDLSKGMMKTFIFPFDYPSAWDRELQAQSTAYTTELGVIRHGGLSAPLVWSARRGLDLGAMLRSLKLSQVIVR